MDVPYHGDPYQSEHDPEHDSDLPGIYDVGWTEEERRDIYGVDWSEPLQDYSFTEKVRKAVRLFGF